MILIDFLAMVLLYAVHKVLHTVNQRDDIGEALFTILMIFGFLFLILDVIDKIKGLF